MIEIKRIVVSLAAVVLLLSPAMLLAAGGSSQPQPSSATPELSPEELAVAAYNQGLKQRDKAWKLEEEAAAAEGKAREKLQGKAQKAYKKAIREFREAVENKPDFFQAWSSLGYSLRKSGEYQESLESYDRALQLNPRYTEAIEYRAEAFLGLNRLDEAKAAYMELFKMDRQRAGELMTAMKRWLEQRRTDAAGVPDSTLDEFTRWVEERSELAAQVGRVAGLDRGW